MSNFKIYQKFESSDVILGKNNTVSSGFFPGGEIEILQSSFTTSSTQTQLTGSNGIYDVLNGTYYTNVFNNSTSNPQLLFSIAYGDFNGNGTQVSSSVHNTKAIYTQFKNLLLGTVDQDGKFSFKTGSSSSPSNIDGSEIFVISFSSDLMRDQIDRGQWHLTVSGSGGLPNTTIIDDYAILTDSEKRENRLVYNIISGSFVDNIGKTVAESSSYSGLGLFYPKNGILVLNANKLSSSAGHYYNNLSSSISDPVNHQSLYRKIQSPSITKPCRVRKSEITPSTHYFIRVKNQDFNFSNNPSFVYQTTTDSVTRGEILSSLQQEPKTYVTTVGLYNDMNELVAVAKLSRPTKKDFQNELLIRVRLDF